MERGKPTEISKAEEQAAGVTQPVEGPTRKIDITVWEEGEDGIMRSRIIRQEVSEERFAQLQAKREKLSERIIGFLKSKGVDLTSLGLGEGE